eukprot:1037664-Pelagomonas_calceolata.AAC.6
MPAAAALTKEGLRLRMSVPAAPPLPSRRSRTTKGPVRVCVCGYTMAPQGGVENSDPHGGFSSSKPARPDTIKM